MKLNPYEKNLLDALLKGKLDLKKISKKDALDYKEAAKNTLAKNKRLNIRISSQDLEGLQLKAVDEGIPYQTLAASILHKYLRGVFVERIRQ